MRVAVLVRRVVNTKRIVRLENSQMREIACGVIYGAKSATPTSLNDSVH